MFAAPSDIYDTLSAALFRAALYVSVADDTDPGREDDLVELQSLSVLMHVLREEHAQNMVIQDVISKVHNHIRDHGNPVDHSDSDIKIVAEGLKAVPAELEAAVVLGLDSLPKDEMQIYVEMVLAAAASVAQAHDEKDHSGFWDRLVMFFSDLHGDPSAKFLYDASDKYDHMRISDVEAKALDDIASAIRSGWVEKFPKDLED